MRGTDETSPPSEQAPLEHAVRAAIRAHSDRGNRHIKVKHIAAALEHPPQRITPIVRELVREGTLAVWRETSGNPIVYRILR